MPKALPIYAIRLRAARGTTTLSQRGLGLELDMDPGGASPRINQYEQGRREPDLLTAQRLAAALNVPLAYLFCEDDVMAEVLVGLHRASKRKRAEALTAMTIALAPKRRTTEKNAS